MKNLFYKGNQGPTEYGLMPQSPSPDKNSSGAYTLSTTDATATTIVSVPLSSGTSCVVEGKIIGKATVGTYAGQVVAYKFVAAFKNHGGTTAAVGSITLDAYEDTNINTATVTAVADDTNDLALIKVTGVASHTIVWSVDYEYLLIKH